MFKFIRGLLLSVTIVFIFTVNGNAQVQTDVPALKDVFANDFKFGCLLSYAHIGFPTDPPVPGQSSVVDPDGGYLIKHHMNSMSPGNWMKSTYIVDISGSATAYSAASTQEERDSIDVHPIVTFNGNIIAQLNWAQRQGFVFRGHTLVWHNQNPGTAFFRSGYTTGGTRLTKEQMTERMKNFIKEVIRIIHEGWPGLLTAMDVVNEAVNDDGTDRTANNEWYTTFGDISFVMKAFEFTRYYTELYGETQMKLYYNDYNTHLSAKADGIVRICQPIYDAGYLDGIGMQDHDQYNSPTAQQWIASYDKFYPICDEMAVTEFDVKPSSDNLTPSVLTTQANQYAMLVKCFLDRSYQSGRGKIINVSKDGLNDNWAFVKKASLWDEDNQCKPAYYEVVELVENYYSLDSLLAVADSLEESEYTSESWAEFETAHSAAQSAMSSNYSYLVSAADELGEARDTLQSAIDNLNISGIYTSNKTAIVENFILGQNYPNPFNPVTTIEFSLPEAREIDLIVYDLLGNTVAELANGKYGAGNHKVSFNASQLSSGIYFYALSAGDFKSVKKLMVVK
ncbi:MAG: endo-1,4-beta-xylanase [Calditrichaceae bacterium]|nr:endo-1,4-beta-xylanase [Calditrichaceae bacterium]MBN2708092.1 endo-1,4-beta-xylanase [Calditrichaceae bacterium]RQV94764.1 MAG: T9SS C-terminal target domain-containing protein [Calditrichota bacterium]